MLTGSDVDQYRSTLAAIHRSARSREHLSPKAMEARFQQALLRALDLRGVVGGTEASRLEEAVTDLERALHEAPTRWEVFLQVEGIDGRGLPIEMGPVEFCLADNDRRVKWQHRVAAVVQASKNTAQEQQETLSFVEAHLANSLGTKTLARVGVQALDETAAMSLAKRRVRLTLDVVNFYSDVVHSRGARAVAHMPGELASVSEEALIFNEGEPQGFQLHSEQRGPLEQLDLTRLTAQGLGMSRVLALLKAKSRSWIGERLLSSIQWAGRATAEQRADQGFLLFMIAIETLLGGGRAEIGAGTYRLRLRCAHVLGDSFQRRQEILGEIQDLYSARSRLIHSGSATVSLTEYGLARNYAKAAIFRFLTRDPFATMNSEEDLETWFASRLLGFVGP